MKKNMQRIMATILTVIMMVSMLPSNIFAADFDADMFVEPAVEAVSVPAEEQEVESTVEYVGEEPAEEVLGASDEFETIDADDPADPAADEIVVDADAPVVDETVTLKAEGSDYAVTVTYGPSAGLPEGADIKVEEVKKNDKKYDEYVGQAADTIASDVEALNYIRLFDISIVDAEGNTVEPNGQVDVKIDLKDVEQVEETTQVVHFAGEEEVPEVVDATVSEGGIAFAADGFSIYAVIGTEASNLLTVNFINVNPDTGEETTLETVYVKKADTTNATEFAKIVYDPGAGTIPDGYAFYGWSIDDPDYSVEAPGKTIEEVRDEIKKFDFSKDDTMNVYAMLAAFYTVKYIDGDGINLGTHTAPVRKIGEEAAYTVNMGYSPDNTGGIEHNFEGWLATDVPGNITDPSDFTAETIFTNGTEIKIKGDVVFSVSAPEGHWLAFEENGKHASYNAPRFVKYGENTNGDDIVTVRNGYTFGGWWTEAPSEEGGVPGGQQFEFGHELTESITVYARWDPVSTADYTIIIWKEGLTKGTWDFEKSFVFTGTVGEATDKVVPQGSGKTGYAQIDGTDYQYEGFSFSEYDADTRIAPEGNTVINVRYIRNEYTLRFWVTSYLLNIPLRELNPITARYGEDISSHFPMRGTILDWPSWMPGVSYLNSLARWNARTHGTFDKPVVFIDTMPAEDITFDSDRSVVDQRTMYYYIEALPEQTPDDTFNGIDFVLYKGPLYARYNYFTETEDFMEIAGCEKYGTNVTFDSEGRSYENTLKCYYKRVAKRINYMDGAYFDGDGYRKFLGSGDLISSSESILYGSDISSYNRGGDDFYAPESPEEGYVLENWYLDQACTQLVDFDRMSSSDMIVYAKWRQIQYRVFLRPNAGTKETDPTLYWGSDRQATNFRVSYGDKVSVPEGTRTGYKFYGWYKDPELNTPVYNQSIVLNEDTVWDDYDMTLKVNMTDPSDEWGNANATKNTDAEEGRFWITKRFELFACWSKETKGAEGIGIIYDAGDGTGAPSDRVLYQDNTTAVAGGAPKPNAGKAFEKWVVQKWDGSAFVDTDVEVLPGQTFRVHVNDAKIVDKETQEVIPLSQVKDDGKYTYTVQVRAKYSDVEEKTPTHITWYKNDGFGDAYKTDDNLKINQRVSVYGLGSGESIPEWPGHKFLGWVKDIEREKDSETINTSSTKTELFLRYDSETGKYYYEDTSTVVEQVAADEITPYEGLYAAWEVLPQIQIYHSSTGDIETIQVKDIPADGLDLTGKVLTGNLYGGYYHYIDGEKGTAYEANGKALKVTEADYGTTYYLKEVPNTYLIPTIYLTYSTLDYDPPKPLRGLWIIMNVDSTYKDSEYKQIGFVRDGTDAPQTGVYDDLTVTKNGKTTTYTMSNFYGPDTTEGVLAIQDMSDYATLPANKDKSFTLSAYWVTPDNVKVTGVKERTYNMGNQTFTGWSGGAGLSYTTTSQASAAVPAGSVVATSIVNRQTYMAKSAPDILTYTVTKVDNGKTVTQVVEAGDNTGKIAYAGKTNYVFAGWYLDKSCTKAADFSAVSSDMTVYAKYVKTSAVKLSFTKKSSKSGSVTFKADLKISGAPALTDTSVNCDCKGKTSAVKFTGAKTTKSGKTEVNTYTGTVTVSGLKDKGSFTAAISYKTPDGTTVNLAEKTCKYASGLVTVK